MWTPVDLRLMYTQRRYTEVPFTGVLSPPFGLLIPTRKCLTCTRENSVEIGLMYREFVLKIFMFTEYYVNLTHKSLSVEC